MVKTEDKINDARENIEAMVWELTGFRGRRETVDKIMSAVDTFATLKAEFLGQHRVRPTSSDPLDPLDVSQDMQDLEEYVKKTAVPTQRSSDLISSIADGEKVCRACGLPKPKSNFTKDRTRSDGYLSRCKDCVKAGKLIPKSS